LLERPADWQAAVDLLRAVPSGESRAVGCESVSPTSGPQGKSAAAQC
jgi:hypothetical protein